MPLAAPPFGLTFEVALLLGVILIAVGLALAFYGRRLWRTLMSLIGALIGSSIGFLAGYAIGGPLIGIVLAIVGAILGSLLFGFLVKVALAFLVGLLAAALVFLVIPGPLPAGTGTGDPRFIAAVIVLIVVFAIAYYFIDELIGVVTAIVGGLLLAGGVYLVLGTGFGLVAGIAGLAAFVFGAILQTIAIRRQKRIAAAQRAAQYAPPPPPPSPPPPPR